ncbi:MAG: hypothetical protein HYX90_02210 [Chloroflexi bacterium]|nr:hypothetical protein [Chloroflexota bacterium]
MAKAVESLNVLDSIPLALDTRKVLPRLTRAGNDSTERVVQELLDTVLPLARSRALYRAVQVISRRGDDVNIGGVTFTGRVLSAHFRSGMEVYPFVSTCGRELDTVKLPATELLRRYCLVVIKGLVLASATDFLTEHLRGRCGGRVARVSPGELELWPIEQQRPLFRLLGDVESAIGVSLSDTLTMSPAMSVSGFFFRDDNFESCRLCPKPCNGRRAAYDHAVVARYR